MNEEMKQCVADCCKWVVLELDNTLHSESLRLQKAHGYLEDAIKLIEAKLEELDEDYIN